MTDAQPGQPAPTSRLARMRPLLTRIVPIAFYALIALALGWMLLTLDWDEVRRLSFDWWLVVAASVVGLASRGWNVAIWLALLRRLGASKFGNIAVLAHAYAKAWLGRYIPGSAAWILGKIYFASRQGVSKSKLAVSSFLEAGLQVLVMLLVGTVLLLVDPRLEVVSGPVRIAMAAAALLCVVALWPAVFNWVATRGFRLVRKRDLDAEHLPNWRAIWQGLWMFTVSTGFVGLSVFLLAKALYPPLGWDQLVFVIAANALASAVSMIVVFAPGGLGVREALLITLLALIMPREAALVVSLLIRVWSIAIDFIFVGLTALLVRLRGGSNDLPAAALATDATPATTTDEGA